MGLMLRQEVNGAFAGAVTIDGDFMVRAADEKAYQFVDEDRCYPFPFLNLLHPDDRKQFCESILHLLPKEEAICTLRAKLNNEEYEQLLFSMMNRGSDYQNQTLYDVRIQRILKFQSALKEQRLLLLKERTLMGLIDCLFFEYSIPAKELTIYMNIQDKEVIVEQQKINLWKDTVISLKYVEEKESGAFLSFCEDLLQGKGSFCYQFINSIQSKGKEWVRWRIRGEAVHETAKTSWIVGTIETNHLNDVNQETYIEEIINKDPLTGLLNKRAITQIAKEKLHFNGNKKLRLVVIDIDNFKNVNDNFGHLFGDKVIASVAEIIERIIGSHGIVGRIGGDEFFAVLEGVDEEKDLRYILKAIRVNVAWAYIDIVNQLNITCSMGSAEYPTDGATYEELFMKADYCLYLAKEKGRNRYIIYDEKKHGKVLLDEWDHKVIGLEGVMKESDKLSAYSRVLMDLVYRKSAAIMDVFNVVGNMCIFEKINLYYGPELALMIHWGKWYEEDADISYLREKEYLKHFDEENVFYLSRINLSEQLKAYQHFIKQHLSSTLQILIGTKESIKGFISFDRTVVKAQLSAMDVYNLGMIAKLIGSILE